MMHYKCLDNGIILLKPTGTRLRRLYNSADLLVTVALTNATVA